MRKPQSLRDHLAKLVPSLASDPDKLLIHVGHGKVRATAASSLSFEYQYTLSLLVIDWPHGPDAIVLPVLMWLTLNQPDLLENYDRQAEGFKFEAELLTDSTVDLSIELALTERVIVTPTLGGLNIEHVGEPVDDDGPLAGAWQLYVKGEMVGEWKT